MNAFADTNIMRFLRPSVDAYARKCADFQPFVKCSAAGDPIAIHIVYNPNIQGLVDFSFFPDTIQNIRFINTKLTGTIDFLHLPRDLTSFIVVKSQFTADFSQMNKNQMPQHLQRIIYGNNELWYGRFDFSKLPCSLQYISLIRMDQLHDIVFHDLPPRLEEILLNGNILNALDLSEALPETLKYFRMMNTRIRNEIKLQGIGNCTLLKFECLSPLCSRIQQAAAVSGVSVAFLSSV